ncbi:hypothetical protein [Alienimonas chondri]|uniref:Uncharacterized protein n=1 Tax=Alienimonas chondri TaxID=2681879 RepID=A0ABX1VFD5_9PLAN|nr:hypothetical protein [Alienimonas chondri]NNJ26818.1 hypothetical protein [Alienimonas chondri]
MPLRLPQLLLAAAAGTTLAVSAPAANAGHGDIGKATALAHAVERHAQATARFGAQVGRPDYLAFGHTASLIAAEAHEIEVKLAVGDVAGAQSCTHHLKGLVKTLDKQEDRLSRCGWNGRDARKAADDFADDVEDTFDDLEDEVEDLKVVPIVVHGGTPHPAILGRPGAGRPGLSRGPVVVGPPVVVTPAPTNPRYDRYQSNPLTPRYDDRGPTPGYGGTAPGGYEYQGESDGRGIYYGPSRGAIDARGSLSAPAPQPVPPGTTRPGTIRPAPGAGGLYDNGGGYSAPRYDGPNDYRPVPSRDSYRPAPAPPRYDDHIEPQSYDGPALPSLPSQARYDRSDRLDRFEESDLGQLLRDVIFRR